MTNRKPNLNMEIVAGIEAAIGMTFVPEVTTSANSFAPVDVMDYIYGVLHTPKYREKYKEFLKIDFPKVPYPKDKETFLTTAKLGLKLRELHLMEAAVLHKPITTYPIDGDNLVSKVKYLDGKVWINSTQYFDKVPAEVFEFHIGGYKVLDKWLKDRKDTSLTFDDIMHYQKIVVSLAETIKVMQELDKLVV